MNIANLVTYLKQKSDVMAAAPAKLLAARCSVICNARPIRYQQQKSQLSQINCLRNNRYYLK